MRYLQTIIKGFYKISSNTFFTLSNSGLRGHSLKLYKEHYNSNIGKFSFSNGVVEHWNNLSEYVVTSTTVNMFKNRYDRFIKNLSGIPHCHPGNTDGNTLNHVKSRLYL